MCMFLFRSMLLFYKMWKRKSESKSVCWRKGEQ